MQKRFNEDCVAFDLDLQDLENNIPQSTWEMVAPHITQDDRKKMCKVSAHCRMTNKKKKILLMQCVMTAPETKEIHCACMQKQLKGKT